MAQVAVKVIRRQGANNDDALKQALKVCPPDVQNSFMKTTFTERSTDLEVWMKLRHDHVLLLYGVAHEFLPGTSVMVCPWLENGTVTNFITSRRDLSLRHLLQLVSALKELFIAVLNYLPDQRRC